jgi:hypothetical protein
MCKCTFKQEVGKAEEISSDTLSSLPPPPSPIVTCYLNGPFLVFEASFLRQYIAASNSFADKFDSLKGKNPTIQSKFYGCIQLRKKDLNYKIYFI